MPAGRPRIQIDKDQFEKLCSLQCTQTEIAEFFACSPDTIDRWCKREYKENFAEIFKKKEQKAISHYEENSLKLPWQVIVPCSSG